MDDYDRFVAALWVLDDALEEIVEQIGQVHECIQEISQGRREGNPLTDRLVVASLLFQDLREIDTTLTRTSSRVRRAMIRALVAEEVPQSRIARTFEVTRQRVSKLLHEAEQDV